MNRRKLEATTTYLCVIILGILAFLLILGMADGIFAWDILPKALEKVAVLIIGSLAIILFACVVVSITLNVSIIASEISKLANRDERK